MRPRRRRVGPLILAGAVLGWLAAGIYYLLSAPEGLRPSMLGGLTSAGTSQIGGPFKLTDQNGLLRSDSEFRGQMMLVFFGYTNCPDVCPTSLGAMTEALNLLGESGNLVRPIFVTIDPARDTVEQLKLYAQGFHPRLVLLTGPENEIARAAKAYRIYAAKSKDSGEGSDYLMDHSSYIYLMGVDGRYVTHFAPGTAPDKMAEAIRQYL